MANRRTVRTSSLYSPRMLQRLAALLVATVLLASGCADEPVPESEKIFIESSSSPLGPSKGDGKASEKPAKPKKETKPKATGQVVTAADVGIQLVAPKGWRALSGADLATTSDEALADFAELAGITTDEFRASFAQGGLYVAGASGSLNVTAVGTGQGLPGEAEFRAQLEPRGFNISTVEDLYTPLGTGRVVYYTLAVGGRTAHGAALFLVVDGTIADITVTTPDGARTRRLMVTVAPTIKRA